MPHENGLDALARNVLRQNDRGRYTVPSGGLYPYQWNWDSAFAALGYSEFDLSRAWVEMETLFEGQWLNGMVPHIQFHCVNDGYFPGPDVWGCTSQVPSSGISQPPVAATIARNIWERDKDFGEPRLKRLFSKILAWHRWFMSWRLDSLGAACVVHPWEAGRDNAPDWDHSLARIDVTDVGHYERRDIQVVDPDMRPTKFDYDRYIWLVELGRKHGWDDGELLRTNPFRMADPTITFILLRANRDLVEIGNSLGESVSELEQWTRILEDGARSLWNPEIESYDSRDAHTQRWSGCISNASFLCWYAGIDGNGMVKQFTRLAETVPFVIPSHDPESDKFDRRRYWRGPVWPVVNALVGIGLEEASLFDEAEMVRDATARLIKAGGFSEYFDPCDGSPAGGREFTWTAAIWLDWASKQTGRKTWAR